MSVRTVVVVAINSSEESESVSAQLCLTLCDPMDCSTRLLHPCNFPGKNTGVGCHFLLQGNLPNPGFKPSCLYCRQLLYHLSHQERLLVFNILLADAQTLFLPPEKSHEGKKRER